MLVPSGELRVVDHVIPVYQCDDCLVPGELFGEPLDMDLNLTFYFNTDGRPIDPATGYPSPSRWIGDVGTGGLAVQFVTLAAVSARSTIARHIWT